MFKDRMVYGTPFEQLEDEEKSAITKRPKGIQDEIVTDERGKRRFHGAFTGGFSAGYFNTVGTKHGWVPQTFKSSREDRADKLNQSAQDFMDEEDLGEFGIATRKLRTKVDFMDSLAAPGEKRLLAWERSSMPSTSQLGDDDSLVHKLTGILRPVNDSIGVRMLKKMGWRPGKGIGQKMTRRALERQKVIDAKSAGKHIDYDEQAVKEVETHVPDAEFAPDDISIFELKQKEDVHGIGYQPLQNTGVLSEKYGTIASTLKTNKRSKGIRGQAFGVGAFEDEDEDIYTNYDLNQYDFEVGATSKAQKDVPKFDSTFVPAQASAHASRKYFTAPQLPSGWRPNPNRIKTMLEKKTPHKIPNMLLKASEKLTPFQRAKLLGERDHSVLELLSSTDREKLRKLGGKNGEKKIEDPKIRRNEAEPFEEEPMKAHRFKKFVAYLKRGIPFPQPLDMTRLEWEKEQTEFQEALSPELRSLLPEIRDRQKPLAKIGFAAPIAEHLKSRFQSETGTEIKNEPSLSSSNDPKVEAVRTKCFGQKTRQKHDWHPAKDLCKRFNVTNPYPDSNVVGTPGLGKISQKDYAAEYSLMDFGGGFRDTGSELSKRQHPSRFDQGPANYGAQSQEKSQKEIKNETLDVQVLNETITPEKKDDIAPMELLAAIFGSNDEEEEESMQSDDDHNNRAEEFPFIRPSVKEPEVRESNEQQRLNELAMAKRANIVSVLDLIEEDNVYGPAMPTQEYLAGNFVAKEVLTIEDNSDEENSSSDENKKKKKDRKREKKLSRKHHKSKKAKKRKIKKSEDL